MSGRKIDFVGSTYYANFLSNGRMNQNPAIDAMAVRKSMLRRVLMEYAINRFKWTGLPESIDPRFLETTLLYNALAVFYYDDDYGKFFAVQGNPAGHPNMYNNPVSFRTYGSNFTSKNLSAVPTVARVRDERGRFTDETITIPEQCIPIWGNALRMPDLDIISTYANEIGEFDRTIEINGINARHTKIIAIDDNRRLSAREINRQIDEGQSVIEISSNGGMDAVPTVLDLNINEHALEKLHIVRTRIWNECMNLLGIDSANQDKKERLVASEVDANNDQIANMRHVNLNARRQAAHMINKRWPELNVWVEYSSDIDAKAQQGPPLSGGLASGEGDE